MAYGSALMQMLQSIVNPHSGYGSPGAYGGGAGYGFGMPPVSGAGGVGDPLAELRRILSGGAQPTQGGAGYGGEQLYSGQPMETTGQAPTPAQPQTPYTGVSGSQPGMPAQRASDETTRNIRTPY